MKIRKKNGKPSWLKKSLPRGGDYQKVKRLLSATGLHTVCQEASCPNIFECFSRDTATFMILGSHCTRNCRFCNVASGPALPVDPCEPQRVAKAARDLNLKYVVVTSVTRDDLDDGGATHFARTIAAIKTYGVKNSEIEVLIPDFQGNKSALEIVVSATPDVLNHNIETVASLYPSVRPEADYQQSLELLKRAKGLNPMIQVKSGIMVGLGEDDKALVETMADLKKNGCDILTLGQYLQPTRSHHPVEKYYTPEEFRSLEKKARTLGFKNVSAGPFVRSSYNARDLFASTT